MAIREWSVEEIVREYKLEDLAKNLMVKEKWFRDIAARIVAREIAIHAMKDIGGSIKNREISLERKLKDTFGNDAIVSHIGPQRRG